jgi:hypothetical protein
MAHFAKLDENNKVLNVIVVNNSVLSVDGIESEQAGINFCKEVTGHESWKQTSFSGSFRKNFAGINYTYDENFDAFIAPQPYPSWKLNYTTCQWEPPIPYPIAEDNYYWKWSEINKEWIKLVGSALTAGN